MRRKLTAALTAIALLPFAAFTYSLRALGLRALGYAGRGLGLTLFHLRFRRKVVLSNLHLALGHELSEKEIQALARNIYCNIGITFLEIARNFALTGQEMRDEVLITDEDRRYFKTCIDRGRGIVFISGHIANWELLAMSVAAHGFPSAIVVKKMTSPISQFLIERQRKKTGLEVIYSGGTIEKMKTVLREGRVIGFMMDQNKTGKKGIRANFFGVPASSIRGLSKLIKETGAAVIPICSFRQPDGTLRVQTLAELPYLTADTVSDPDEKMLREEWLNAQQYQTAIESMVRMHPEQWLWIHRRWKADRTPLSFETAHLENR